MISVGMQWECWKIPLSKHQIWIFWLTAEYFTNAHVTTSICCCSRASILSRQYVSRHGINGFSTPFSQEAVKETYLLLLKENGYSIGFIGKCGVGNPNEFPDTLYDYWAYDAKRQLNYENEDFIHYTDLVNERIMKFLNTYGKEEKPFCLLVLKFRIVSTEIRASLFMLNVTDIYITVWRQTFCLWRE